MDVLTPRERHILTERKLKDEPATLEELAQVYGVSRERIRQIEVRAFERVQRAVLAAANTQHRCSWPPNQGWQRVEYAAAYSTRTAFS